MTDDEIRITDPNTGGQKGSKVAQLGFIDPLALLELAKIAGVGSTKYEKYNYLKGYDWSLSFNAMMRHALAFWSGEIHDPETGCNHAAMAAWHGLALTSFSERDLGTDDRFIQSVESTTKEIPACLEHPSYQIIHDHSTNEWRVADQSGRFKTFVTKDAADAWVALRCSWDSHSD